MGKEERIKLIFDCKLSSNNIVNLLEEIEQNIPTMMLREPLNTRFAIGIYEMLSMWKAGMRVPEYGVYSYQLTRVLKAALYSGDDLEFHAVWEALENLMMIMVLATKS